MQLYGTSLYLIQTSFKINRFLEAIIKCLYKEQVIILIIYTNETYPIDLSLFSHQMAGSYSMLPDCSVCHSMFRVFLHVTGMYMISKSNFHIKMHYYPIPRQLSAILYLFMVAMPIQKSSITNILFARGAHSIRGVAAKVL